VFERTYCKKTDENFYRITQEGAEILFNCIQKRKIQVSIEELFAFEGIVTLNFNDIKNEHHALKQLRDEGELGFYILYTADETGRLVDLVIIQKVLTSFGLMSSKEHMMALELKYRVL